MSDYKHILFAIDHDDNASIILKGMMDFSDKFNAKVSLVHVVSSLSASYTEATLHLSGFYSMLMSDDKDIKQDIGVRARDYLNDIAKSAGFPIEDAYILNWEPTKSILKYAEENDCDLIVVNGHKHNVIGRIWSAADELINESKIDVVVLKSLVEWIKIKNLCGN